MKSFSLLQRSLEPKIDRATLERAAAQVSSIARADCAQIARDCFGIVVSGLERRDAESLQLALARSDFNTELIADADIPVLPEPFTVQRFAHDGLELIFTDTMGQIHPRPLSEVAFIAGGVMDHLHRKLRIPEGDDDSGFRTRKARAKAGNQYQVQSIPEYRLDFFFLTEPLRFRVCLNENNVFFYQGEPLRLRHATELRTMMAALVEMLPQHLIGRGLQQDNIDRFYPNLNSYEREIRWHFHRLRNQGVVIPGQRDASDLSS